MVAGLCFKVGMHSTFIPLILSRSQMEVSVPFIFLCSNHRFKSLQFLFRLIDYWKMQPLVFIVIIQRVSLIIHCEIFLKIEITETEKLSPKISEIVFFKCKMNDLRDSNSAYNFFFEL